jgi:hypothetical protein
MARSGEHAIFERRPEGLVRWVVLGSQSLARLDPVE